MPRLLAAVAALALLAGVGLVASPARARNTVYHLSIREVLDSPDFRTRVGNDVAFIFGNRPAPAGAKVMATYVSNRKTNSVGKSDERACAWAMLSALVSLRDRANELGGNAVVNVVSYYDKKTFASETEYECHAGGIVAGVALQGTIAAVRK